MPIPQIRRTLLCRLLPVALALPAWSAADDAIRFAPLPMENRAVTVQAFNPLVAYLDRQLDERRVTMAYFERYDDILAAFERDEVDVAFLGPLPYVMLRRRDADAEPLVRFKEPDGSATYRCALIAFGGDDTRLDTLKGKPIGLTQPLSTCGYLGTDAILRGQAGISLEQTAWRYLGSHEKVALGVVAGEVAAGSVKEEFALKFAPLGLTVLAYSGPLPATALVANRATLGDAGVERLRRALLAAPPAEYRRWGSTLRHGMESAADADFDPLRRFGDLDAIPPRKAR